MDIRRLEIFCEVYRQRGYSSAAKRLHLTQSAVSQAIKALEAELGAPLFDGENRSEPTAAGDYLFGEVGLILAHVADIRNGIQQASGLAGGAVRFGMIDVAAIEIMPDALKEFKAKYPKVKLEAVVKATGELVEMVEGHRLDFAVAVTNGLPNTVASSDIYRDSIVAVVPRGSSLAVAGLSIRNLRGEPLILYPPNSYSRHIIDEAFHSRGIVPAVSMEMHYPAAICSLVQQGMGIGLISRLSADESRMRSQRIVPIKELAHVRRIGVIVHGRRRLSPQAHALVTMLKRRSA